MSCHAPWRKEENANVRLLIRPKMMCLGLVGRHKVVVVWKGLKTTGHGLSLHLAEEAVEIELFLILLLVPQIA